MLCIEYGFNAKFEQSETMEEKLFRIQNQQEELKRSEEFLKIIANKRKVI